MTLFPEKKKFSIPKSILNKSVGLIITLFLINPVCLNAQKDSINDKTTFSFGGYIKGDFLHTWYANGDIIPESPMKDFHFPAQIPVGPAAVNYYQDAHIKESRFSFDINTQLLDKEIHGFLELDFLLSAQGNERISNSFAPRMRHFYFEWGNFLFGQTWSTFMIVVLPSDLDFTAAAEGLAFNRQPMIRFSYKNWQFALENPETTLTSFQGSRVYESEKEARPDVVIRRNFNTKSGFWAISLIGRRLNGLDPQTEQDKKTYAFGVSTGGKFRVGDKGDDFRFMTTYGTGLGRYVGLGFTSGGVFDQNGDIHGIKTINGYLAYNHFWIPEKWSSSFNISAFEALHDMSLIGNNANDMAYSLSANLKYTPAAELLFGIELMYGYRELANQIDYGSFTRIQFSAKYSFRYKNSTANEKR